MAYRSGNAAAGLWRGGSNPSRIRTGSDVTASDQRGNEHAGPRRQPERFASNERFASKWKQRGFTNPRQFASGCFTGRQPARGGHATDDELSTHGTR